MARAVLSLQKEWRNLAHAAPEDGSRLLLERLAARLDGLTE
jgi:hypothetical protein